MRLTRTIFSNASQTPSDATSTRPPVSGTRTCEQVESQISQICSRTWPFTHLKQARECREHLTHARSAWTQSAAEQAGYTSRVSSIACNHMAGNSVCAEVGKQIAG